MITVYQAFKIILGIIASMFIIYFLINYSGVYSQIQGTFQRNVVVKNFLETVNNVYLTGIPVNYNDFSKVDVDLYYRAKEAVLGFSGGSFPVRFPLLLKPGKRLYIYRNALNYGWWKFYFIEALPDIDIIFNPLEEDTENLVRGIVKVFPSTMITGPKLRFGFCNGTSVGERYGQHDFLNMIYDLPVLEKCNAKLGKKQVLVTISGNCNQYFIDNGICLTKSLEGTGYAFINASDEVYLYKDPVDVAAMIIGGNERNEFGVLAESLFVHKNNMFRDELLVATKVIGRRAFLVSQNIANADCSRKFMDFRDVLLEINGMVLEKEYYRFEDVKNLQTKLSESKDLYMELVNMGCEVI